MTNPPPSNTCPQCRVALPADAPQGLCPACLLAAVAEPTEAGTAPLPKAPPPTRDQVAAAFPQLEILELIGAGGMGYVFKARQPKLDRLVALKLLPQHLGADAAFAGRFEREGRLLARLSHPNIVTVHDFGFARAGDLQSPSLSTLNHQPSTSQTGFYYLLMEFVDGVNLRQAMRAGRFTPVQALEVVPKICEALQFAHEQGILHRDIKPENILLDAKGRVKLVDFGIAKLIGPAEAILPADSKRPQMGNQEAAGAEICGRLESAGKPSPSESGLTSATAALGTPSYMAPEQRDRPAEVDHRADIYSLGVVFYEMLTGELPVGKFAPPSAKSASDPRVDEVVLRALEQQREHRQQSAGEIKTQIETITASPSGSRREEAKSPSAPRPFLKVGTATLTTPAQLATARGQFFAYQTRGQLILDDRQLTHARDGTNTIIPLAAIRDLSLGQYPRSMNPAGISLLSVTYEEDGQRQQVLLSPMHGWFGLPSAFNALVAEWHTAVRAAVTAATGKAPTETPAPPPSPTVSDLVWMVLLFGVPMGLISVVLFSLSRVVAPAAPLSPANEFILSLLSLAVVIPFLTLYLLPRWGRPPGGSQPPHAPRKPSLWPTLALAAFCAPLLVHLLMLTTGQVPPEPTHDVGRLVFSFSGTLGLAVLAGVGLWLRHRRE